MNSNLVTAEQRENLTKLAEFLRTKVKPKSFDMTVFRSTAGGEDDVELEDLDPVGRHACGSVGCAIGHGPYAGIQPEGNEDWITYAGRCFGAPFNSVVWHGLFAGDWGHHVRSNTPKATATRIEKFLEKGILNNHVGMRLVG